jgi:hypothetical protein
MKVEVRGKDGARHFAKAHIGHVHADADGRKAYSSPTAVADEWPAAIPRSFAPTIPYASTREPALQARARFALLPVELRDAAQETHCDPITVERARHAVVMRRLDVAPQKFARALISPRRGSCGTVSAIRKPKTSARCGRPIPSRCNASRPHRSRTRTRHESCLSMPHESLRRQFGRLAGIAAPHRHCHRVVGNRRADCVDQRKRKGDVQRVAVCQVVWKPSAHLLSGSKCGTRTCLRVPSAYIRPRSIPHDPHPHAPLSSHYSPL